MKRKTILIALFVAAAAVASLGIVTAGRSLVASRSVTGVQGAAGGREVIVPGLLRRGALPPRLREALVVLGDRLERPGKERLFIEGVLSQGGRDVPVRVVSEQPGRLRVEPRGGRGGMVFNEHPGGGLSALERGERAVVETLAFDTPERFFLTQARGGSSTRFVGPRFRLDDGSAQDYTGPFYDIYEVTSEGADGDEASRQTKLFYFNSNTLLPERVRYLTQRGGAPLQVEVVLGDWREVQGQRVPHRIVRTEAGETVLALTITSASFGPRREDGLFAAQPR